MRNPWTKGYAERFNRTPLEEFYQPSLMRKNYKTIAELQADLDKYLYFYNFQRTRQGYRLKGSAPSSDLKSTYRLIYILNILLGGFCINCKHQS